MSKLQNSYFGFENNIPIKKKPLKPRKTMQSYKNIEIRTIEKLYETKNIHYLIPNKSSNLFTKKHVSITKMKNNRNNSKNNIASCYSTDKPVRNLKQKTTNIFNYNFIGAINQKNINSVIYSPNRDFLNYIGNSVMLNKNTNFNQKYNNDQKINLDYSVNITDRIHKIKQFLMDDSKDINQNSDYDYYTYLSVYKNNGSLYKNNINQTINDNIYPLCNNNLLEINLINDLPSMKNKPIENIDNIRFKNINQINKANCYSYNNLMNTSPRNTRTNTRNVSPNHQIAYSYYNNKDRNTFTYSKSPEIHSCNNIKIKKITPIFRNVNFDNNNLNNNIYTMISNSNKKIKSTTKDDIKKVNLKSAMNPNKKLATKIILSKVPKKKKKKINSKKELDNLYCDNSNKLNINKNVKSKKIFIPVFKTNEENFINKNIASPKNKEEEIDSISMQSMNDTKILELAKYIMKNNKEDIIDKNLIENLLSNKKNKGS